jgi:hypothetical protein
MKPFMYAIANKLGQAVIEEYCVAEHPSHLAEGMDEAGSDKIVAVYSEFQIESMADDILMAFIKQQSTRPYSASFNEWNLKCMRGAIKSVLQQPNAPRSLDAPVIPPDGKGVDTHSSVSPC